MGFLVRQMAIEDYNDVLALWKGSDAIVLSKVDSQDIIKRLLERNTGLSFVALDGDTIIGAVLCSHDGRLGYLSHLVVSDDYRRQGIGRQLVSRCMYSLTGLGIHKCILLIMKETEEALQFWRTVDPAGRVSLVMMGPRDS